MKLRSLRHSFDDVKHRARYFHFILAEFQICALFSSNVSHFLTRLFTPDPQPELQNSTDAEKRDIICWYFDITLANTILNTPFLKIASPLCANGAPWSIPASTAGCAYGRCRARAFGQINMYGKMPAAWLEERLLSQEATHSSIILSAVQLDYDIGQTSK